MVMRAVTAPIVATLLVRSLGRRSFPGDRELHRFGRSVEALRLGLLDPYADLGDAVEPLKDCARDVGRHPLEERPRAAGDLIPHAGGDLGDVEGGRELVSDDRVRNVHREVDVDQVVVRLLLVRGRGPLPAATPQAPDDDATGHLVHDRGIQLAPYLLDG